jgi:hypothetical protein
LEVLNLANNKLENLNRALECLSDCRRLKVLDLHGNPVAEEDHYRARVIARLPSVEVLDRHRVTSKEREQAKKIRRSSSSGSVGLANTRTPTQLQSASATKNADANDDGDNEQSVVLASALQKLRKRVTEKRLDLEPEWRAQDARRLGAVSMQEMLRILRLYSLDLLLNEQEVEVLRTRFVKDVRIPTSFYEPRLRIEKLFDYASFCRTIKRTNLDEEAHRQQDDDKHLSATVKDLKAFVTRVNLRESRKASKLPPRAMTADPTMMATMARSSTALPSQSTWRSQHEASSSHDSRPWEVMECKQLLDRACPGNKSIVVTEQPLQEFVRLMAESGRKLDIPQLRQCAGEPLTKERVVNALYNPSVWRLLTPEEANATKDLLFERAQTALQRLGEQQARAMTAGQRQALQQQLRDSLTFGYRIHSMANQINSLQRTQFKSTLPGKQQQQQQHKPNHRRGDYFVLRRPVTTSSTTISSTDGHHQDGHVFVSSQVFRIC